MQKVINYCIEKVTLLTGNKQMSRLVVGAGSLFIAAIIIMLVLPGDTPESRFDADSVDVELQRP